jgi:shikimate dehydrogenase
LKHFGLIGRTLSHSFSKKFFTTKFSNENIDASYSNYELSSIEDFPSLFTNDVFLNGLNVTIPYKENVIEYLDELHPVADEIQAVNTILPVYNNGSLKKLIGYNTDAYGFSQLIKPYLKSNHQKALILGTGGASKAVSYVLRNLGVDVHYVSRSESNANSNVFSWDMVNNNMIKFHQLIINTTPIGMSPNIKEVIPIPYSAITNTHLLIDLIYNPEETQFLKRGKQQGARCLNGTNMLIHQAIKAWNIWNMEHSIQ